MNLLRRAVLFVFFVLINIAFIKAQNKEMPKLVVSVVIDQMRYDYLNKFSDLYGEGGFKRLMKGGANFTFTNLNYTPAYTAVGHATIYTGATPYFHGIIANDFYDRSAKKIIAPLYDASYNTLGALDKNGEKSPKRLIASTITDELKLFSSGKSKVISISTKDRASILPGGHMADAAFWYNPGNGSFISSTYYMKNLPGWVILFNEKKMALEYMNKDWELSFPTEKYVYTLPDNCKWEPDYFKEGDNTFPHTFNNLTEDEKLHLISNTPYGNEILFDFTAKALAAEELGKDSITDFLAVSFSPTDYVGHVYGPNSFEIADTYAKMDNIIERMLNLLDEKVGEGNYLFVITADHGGSYPFEYLKENNMVSGGFLKKGTVDKINNFIQKEFGDTNILASLSNSQLFLDNDLIVKKGFNPREARLKIAEYLKNNFNEITKAVTRDQLEASYPARDGKDFLLNGFHPVRSGDILLEFIPGYYYAKPKTDVTSHETRYSSDSHIPLIFYGWNINAGTFNKPAYIVDIAATIADMLGINAPNCSMGIPLIKH